MGRYAHPDHPGVDYPDVGQIVDGIPMVIPADGWYWLQVGLGLRVQWHVCFLQGSWVKTLVDVWHWENREFHERHRLGPRLVPPAFGAEPFPPEREH